MTFQQFQNDDDRRLELRKVLANPVLQEAIAILKDSLPNDLLPVGVTAPHDVAVRYGDMCAWLRFPRQLAQMAERPVNLTPPVETYAPEPDETPDE